MNPIIHQSSVQIASYEHFMHPVNNLTSNLGIYERLRTLTHTHAHIREHTCVKREKTLSNI